MLPLGSTKVRRTVFPVACARTLRVPLGTIIRLPVSSPLQFRVSCTQQERSSILARLAQRLVVRVIWLIPDQLYGRAFVKCQPYVVCCADLGLLQPKKRRCPPDLPSEGISVGPDYIRIMPKR